VPENRPSATDPRSFTIVIPAFNEEEAIAATIERTLRARDAVCKCTTLTEVNVVVVSDGSTDCTAEIARRYTDVKLLVFEKNRGYGAAIKAGWELAPADLLGFLDADGTCDPQFFVPMCQAVLDDGYDLVLGSRMGRNSRMPGLRRIGNGLFALLLG
jgi:glycosyltransferase involved in cell wall biosynthesis